MEKIKIYILLIMLNSAFISAQTGMENYKEKTFIFDSYEEINACTSTGNKVSTIPTTALKGSLFTIVHITDTGDLVIAFNIWLLPKKNNTKKYAIAKKNYDVFNIVPGKSHNDTVKQKDQQGKDDSNYINDSLRFFLLKKVVMERSCSEYIKKWDISLGTIFTPFKFRRSPFLYEKNLNLGTSVCFQKKLHANFSWGVVIGFSLSSITLDSVSTKGVVRANTERPAVTPSLHGMIGYKNINLTVGIGIDLINKISGAENSWIYQGKPWLGVGIGISLFNANNNEASQGKPLNQAK